MFEPIGLEFSGSYLHNPAEYQVKELCRIVSFSNGMVFAVFDTEETAEECAIFFPSNLGYYDYNGFRNAIRIA